jgi:hypothetical protein
MAPLDGGVEVPVAEGRAHDAAVEAEPGVVARLDRYAEASLEATAPGARAGRQAQAAVAAQGRPEQRRQVVARTAGADEEAVGDPDVEREGSQRRRTVADWRRAVASQCLVEGQAGHGGKRRQRDERRGERAQPSIRRNERLRQRPGRPSTL